jgi:hypothetical protein
VTPLDPRPDAASRAPTARFRGTAGDRDPSSLARSRRLTGSPSRPGRRARQLIGSALDFEQWRLVLSGYYAVYDARYLCETALDDEESREITSARLQVQLAQVQNSIAIACDVIGSLIEGFDKDPFPVDRVEVTREMVEQANREWRKELGPKSGTN